MSRHDLGGWADNVVNAPQRKRPYTIIDPIAWQGQTPKPREWLIEGWIPMRNVTLLGGDGGLGKSLLAMQLMTAAATGRSWLGLEARACKSFGYFCEDEPEELHRRMADVTRHYDIEFGDLSDMRVVSRVGADNSLMVFDGGFGPGEATDILGSLHNDCLDHGAQCIVLDSLHDLFAGNENSRLQARQFIGELRALATECDAAVVLTAHPSLTGRNTGSGEAGSTAWNNAVRSRLYLKHPPPQANGFGGDEDEAPHLPNDHRVLETMKSNYAKSGTRLNLRWQDGVYVAQQPETGIDKRARESKSQRVFLKLLAHFNSTGRTVDAKPKSQHYAPRVFMASNLREDVGRSDLEQAMHALLDRGAVQVQQKGIPSRPREVLVADDKARNLPF